jgi:hypothetical protein
MQLPIYRRLDERLKILGLSLIELSLVGGLYVLLTQVLSFWSYGTIAALSLSTLIVVALLYLHRKHESHFISKWMRFASLPEGCAKQVIRSQSYERKTL